MIAKAVRCRLSVVDVSLIVPPATSKQTQADQGQATKIVLAVVSSSLDPLALRVDEAARLERTSRYGRTRLRRSAAPAWLTTSDRDHPGSRRPRQQLGVMDETRWGARSRRRETADPGMMPPPRISPRVP